MPRMFRITFYNGDQEQTIVIAAANTLQAVTVFNLDPEYGGYEVADIEEVA